MRGFSRSIKTASQSGAMNRYFLNLLFSLSIFWFCIEFYRWLFLKVSRWLSFGFDRFWLWFLDRLNRFGDRLSNRCFSRVYRLDNWRHRFRCRFRCLAGYLFYFFFQRFNFFLFLNNPLSDWMFQTEVALGLDFSGIANLISRISGFFPKNPNKENPKKSQVIQINFDFYRLKSQKILVQL